MKSAPIRNPVVLYKINSIYWGKVIPRKTTNAQSLFTHKSRWSYVQGQENVLIVGYCHI